MASLSFPDYRNPDRQRNQGVPGGQERLPGRGEAHAVRGQQVGEGVADQESQAENDVVIVNRYTESNLVYGVANGLRLEWLAALEKGIPRSDLVVVLDAPTKALATRRPGPKDSYEKDRELASTRPGALQGSSAPKFGWVTIDGSRSVDSVHGSIVEAVKGNLDAGLRAKP